MSTRSVQGFVPGEIVRVSLSIKNSSQQAADPGALRLKVKAPDGTVTTYIYGVSSEIDRLEVGQYQADILASAEGAWCCRWETDAPNAGATEFQFNVKRSIIN